MEIEAFDVLVYPLGSRYCDTQPLLDFAWRTFGTSKPGWARVDSDRETPQNVFYVGARIEDINLK
jgi:hypothetical protein